MTREQRCSVSTADPRQNLLLEEFYDVDALTFRGGFDRDIRRMRPQQMIDCRARRRLTALVEPKAGHPPREIRYPDPRNETGVYRSRHDAGGRPHDVGQPPRHVDIEARAVSPADRAGSPRMCV